MFNSPITHTKLTGNILEATELGIPRYNGQILGSQWCPLLRGSTVCKNYESSLSRNLHSLWWTMTYMENVMKFHTQNNNKETDTPPTFHHACVANTVLMLYLLEIHTVESL